MTFNMEAAALPGDASCHLAQDWLVDCAVDIQDGCRIEVLQPEVELTQDIPHTDHEFIREHIVIADIVHNFSEIVLATDRPVNIQGLQERRVPVDDILDCHHKVFALRSDPVPLEREIGPHREELSGQRIQILLSLAIQEELEGKGQQCPSVAGKAVEFQDRTGWDILCLRQVEPSDNAVPGIASEFSLVDFLRDAVHRLAPSGRSFLLTRGLLGVDKCRQDASACSTGSKDFLPGCYPLRKDKTIILRERERDAGLCRVVKIEKFESVGVTNRIVPLVPNGEFLLRNLMDTVG